MVKVSGKVIIGIGSSDKGGTRDNPFSVVERRDMIQRALQAVDIIPMYDVVFIDVPDHPDDEMWTKKVLELAGRIDKVWTGDPRTRACFDREAIEIQEIREVPGINATEIRKRMKEGGDWQVLVPSDVANAIVALDGVERVKKMK